MCRTRHPLRAAVRRHADTRVFPGIVLPVDGLEGLRVRHDTASRYLDELGVAMYCGFGRQPGHNGMETMREHRDTVQGLLGAAASATS
jgi:hypothetical protein